MTNWFIQDGKVLMVDGKIRGCCCGPSQAFVVRQCVLTNLSSTWNGTWRYAEIADVYFDIVLVGGIWVVLNVMSYGTGVSARTSYGYSSLCADTSEVVMLPSLDVSQNGICNVLVPICGYFQFNFLSSPVGVVGNIPNDFQTFEVVNNYPFPCTKNPLDSWSVFGERLK